ncbi:MAG: tetratricopeptide repeat protein [Bacteroidales bacterium]
MKKNIILLFLLITAGFFTSCKPREQKAQELLNEGTVMVAQGRHDEAIDLFTRAIKLLPEFAQAYTYRGSAKFDKGDLIGAHDDYTKAIEIDPTYAEPYDFRGRIKLIWSDEDGACEDFKKAYALGRPGMYERLRRCQ